MRWINSSYFKVPGIWSLILLLLITQTGCIQYYRVSGLDYPKDPDITLTDLNNLNVNYYFVHVGDKVFELSDVTFWQNGEIKGQIIPLQKNVYKLYEAALAKQNGVVHKKGSTTNYQIQQIHFYVSSLEKSETDILTIKTEDIENTHLLHNDNARTIAASTGTTLLVSAAALGVFLLIACQCPHIYTEDGNQHISNAFVGAVSKELEQSDFIQITTSESNNTILNFVNEEVGETHYFNEIKLLKVNHAENVSILPDQNGELYSLENILEPENSELISKDDGLFLGFDQLNSKTDLAEYEVTFTKPKEITGNSAKLVLRVKNSSWASYVMEQWYGLFGSRVDEFRQNTAEMPAEKQLKWQKDQGMTLSIFTLDNKKWEFQSDVKIVGNTVYRDLVVPIEFNNDDENVTIKLSAGFKLWSIDYLGIDFSTNEILGVEEIIPLNIENKELTTISSIDDEYLTVNYGDTLSIDFGKLTHAGSSYILKTQGYYTKDVDGVGELKKGEVKSFKKKGQMSRFSFFLYDQATQDLGINE